MECPVCRAPVAVGSRFCPSCGHALTSRAEERRVVTVLFGDLVGFTGLSEGVDPEQVKNLVDRAFQRLVDDIASHGGRVDKIVGDQIMALFGAPVTHEDDAERAVRAALQMQATLETYAAETGVPVRMRIGINTGEVLVGTLRAGGDYTAMGDTVNVASRLQTSALPGQVLVGPVTHAQTAGVIRYQPLGPLRARGRGEPVEVHAAAETVGPPGQRPRRAKTPLLGRDQEMAILCSAMTLAFERRRPQFILLFGEAGIGKTRLAEELTQTAARAHGALVLEGRCVPYGEANVWWPMATAIRQALGIGVDDTAEEAQAKCLAKVAWGLRLPEDDSHVLRATDGLLYLLGITPALTEVDPGRARDDAARSLIGLLENLARRRPLVLAVSELHWADELVLDLLDRLPGSLRGLPFVVITDSRPELEERWTPKPGRHNLLALHLDPLDRDVARTLLSRLLDGASSAELTEAVLDRSGGNPFFLEELAGLVHQGTGQRELPATLRALVAARLDNLPDGERRVVNHAAVVGRIGSLEALTALGAESDHPDVAESIDRLIGRDVLALEGDQWVFRSDLVREVAYETLTKAERARHHARLGGILASQARQRGRESEQLEALAHHFAQAAELVHQLGAISGVPSDVLDEALTWIERSVTQVEQQEIPAAAAKLCTRALELLPEDRGEERRRFLVRRGRALTGLRQIDGARADVAVAQAEAEAAGDRWAAAAALTVRGHIEQTEGALHESAADLDDAIGRWRVLGDRASEADARRLRGMTDLFLGRLGDAESNIAEALALFRDLGDRRGEAWALQNMAWISTTAGDNAEAAQRTLESVRLFKEIGDWSGLGWGYGLLGWVRLQQGYLADADELAQRVLVEYGESDDPWAEGMMRLLLAWTRLWLGRTDEAVERATEARSLFAAIGDSAGELRSVGTLARGLLAAGRLGEATELLALASTMAERELDAEARALGRLISADTAVQLGEASRMLDLDEWLEPATPRKGPGGDHRVPAGVALLQLGRLDEARSRLEGAFTETSEPGLLHAAGSALALAHAAAGDSEQALAIADKVDALEHGTYLDRIGTRFARGFAFVRQGRVDDARREMAGAVALADTTGDRLNQALTRLAQARALEAVGDPAAPGCLAGARERLAAIGLPETGWDGVFLRAAGFLGSQGGR